MSLPPILGQRIRGGFLPPRVGPLQKSLAGDFTGGWRRGTHSPRHMVYNHESAFLFLKQVNQVQVTPQ